VRRTTLAICASLATLSATGARELALRPLETPPEGIAAAPLWQTIPDADRGAKTLAIEPAQPCRWVFAPGEPIRLTIRVTPEAEGQSALLTVWDWANRAVAQEVYPVPTDEPLDVTVDGRGTYLLTLDLVGDGQPVSRLARSFAMCPDSAGLQAAWRQAEFEPGTCAFPGRQHWTNDYGPAHPPELTEEETRSLEAELSRRLGLALVRPDVGVEWAAEDEPIDFARCDAAMAAWTSRGFRINLQLPMPPDWAIAEPYGDVADPKWRYPKREGPSRRLVREVAERYGKSAAFIELWNEPDNRGFWRGTPEEYLEWAGWARDELATAAPGVPVANGGYCLIEPVWTGLFARGFAGKADIVAYHSHGGNVDLDATLAAMRAVHAAVGSTKPVLVNTEMGHAAWRLDMERAQAATSIQKLLTCWSEGHKAALLYSSREIGGPRQRPADPDWGALDYQLCPRFVYGALSAFLETYAGARFERMLVRTRDAFVGLFSRGGDRLVAAFVTHDGAATFVLQTDARAARLVDPMGNARPLADPASVEVRAGYLLTTLVLEGATRVDVK